MITLQIVILIKRVIKNLAIKTGIIKEKIVVLMQILIKVKIQDIEVLIDQMIIFLNVVEEEVIGEEEDSTKTIKVTLEVEVEVEEEEIKVIKDFEVEIEDEDVDVDVVEIMKMKEIGIIFPLTITLMTIIITQLSILTFQNQNKLKHQMIIDL